MTTELLQHVCPNPNCGSRLTQLLSIELKEGSATLSVRCESCGSLSFLELGGDIESPEELEPIKKKEVSYLG